AHASRARRRRGRGAAGPRLLDRRPPFLRLHADHRQEGSRPGNRLDRVRLVDHRAGDHVLPAAPPDLGAADADRGAGARRPVRPLRARVPAFDALEPGDVAIVPVAALAIVAPDRDGVVALVRGCVDAGIAGLLIVEDAESGPGIAAGLRESAAEAGLSALDVG